MSTFERLNKLKQLVEILCGLLNEGEKCRLDEEEIIPMSHNLFRIGITLTAPEDSDLIVLLPKKPPEGVSLVMVVLGPDQQIINTIKLHDPSVDLQLKAINGV